MAKTNQEPTNPFLAHEAFSSLVIQHHLGTLLQPLKHWKSSQHLPPVLLLSGPPGIGKRWMTTFIAQWIFCSETGFHSQTSSSVIPCRTCPSCRKFLTGNEVNFTTISAQSEEETSRSSGALKIDQFRKLKSSVGFGAHESSYRVISIPDAERMTPQAANSILKLLEEPPRGWIFVLTCTDAELLLPTLVSRCQIFRLRPFSPQQIQKLLAFTSIPPDRIEICAQLSQGSWDRALAFSTDSVWKQRTTLFEFLTDPIRVFQTLMDSASENPQHFEILIDLLEQFTADLLRWSVSPFVSAPEKFDWVHKDGAEFFSLHTQQIIQAQGSLVQAQNFWFGRAERMARARKEALAPLNRKLLLQDFLLPWIGAQSR